MSAVSSTHTGLLNGALIDLAVPDWRLIDLGSIAVQLSRIPRFLGATVRPVSVLEHSLNVARIVPVRLRLAALLHDAHEALIGDLTRPMRQVLARECGPDVRLALELITDRLDVAIAMQVLALAPDHQSGPPDSGVHQAFARTIADQFNSEHLRLADDALCEAEIRAYTRFGRSGAEPALSPAPDQDGLVTEWMQALEHLVALRFGVSREPVSAAAWWLQP